VLTINTQFEVELKKLIAEEVARLKDILADGQAVTDYDAYRFLTGQLFAYARITDAYCDEVKTTISKR